MKLIKSDGRTLSVWDIGDVPIYEVRAGAYPLKCNGYRILDDEAARALVRELRGAQDDGDRAAA
jgi:hypothetical protein